MKKRTLILGTVPVIGLLVAGLSVSTALAFGPGFGRSSSPDEVASRQMQMFQQEADLLGITVDEVKDAWADGKTMKQLMEEKGITHDQVQIKMKGQLQQRMKSRLQAFVEKGVITQAQADKRLAAMEKVPVRGHGWGFDLGSGMRHGGQRK